MRFNFKRVRIARENAGLKQHHAATRLAKDKSTITKKEGGKIDYDLNELATLAELYNVDLSEFFDFNGREPIFENVKIVDSFNRGANSPGNTSKAEEGLSTRDDIDHLKGTIKFLQDLNLKLQAKIDAYEAGGAPPGESFDPAANRG